MASPTINAVMVLAMFVFLSLAVAYIVFRMLKSTALIKSKTVQLGGAAAMFVVIFILLNRYLPEIRRGFIEEASVAQPVASVTNGSLKQIATVELRPSYQLISSIEFLKLDRNKYRVEEGHGVGLPKTILGDWKLTELGNIPLISITDVPAFEVNQDMPKAMFADQKQEAFRVRAVNSKTIIISESSSINGIRFNFNIFREPKFIVSAAKAQAESMTKLGARPDIKIPDTLYALAVSEMANRFDAIVHQQFPKRKEVYSGVLVMPLSKEFLDRNILSRAGYTSLLLDNAFMYVTVSGIFGMGQIRNLFVDQNARIASFNATVRLNNITVGNKSMDVVINNIGFITAATDRAYFVLLTYSSIDDVTVFQTLDRVLDELRFYG